MSPSFLFPRRHSERSEESLFIYLRSDSDLLKET